MLNFKFNETYDVDDEIEALVYVNGVLSDYYEPLVRLYIIDDSECDNYLFIRNNTHHRYFYDLSDKIKVLVRKKNLDIFGWGTLDGSEEVAFEN